MKRKVPNKYLEATMQGMGSNKGLFNAQSLQNNSTVQKLPITFNSSKDPDPQVTASPGKAEVNESDDSDGWINPKKTIAYDNSHLFERITLSFSQMRVLEAIAEGRSVFFTGAAGSGKSYVLKLLQDIYTTTDRSREISFTAPTGVAACNIGGLTIHSWSGIGTGDGGKERIFHRIRNDNVVRRRWEETKVLVIDEISMMPGWMFDLLSYIGQNIRHNELPFGGIQLVLCGDFFQLPPIGLSDSGKPGKDYVSYCFECQTWRDIFGNTNGSLLVDSTSVLNTHNISANGVLIALEKVFRQKDEIFLNVLNDVRLNSLSPQSKQVLEYKDYQSKSIPIEYSETLSSSVSSDSSNSDTIKIQYTKLYATNKDVNAFNSIQLQRLLPYEGSEEAVPLLSTDRSVINQMKCLASDTQTIIPRVYRYKAIDRGEKKYLDQLINGLKASDEIDLKIGAQVMLVKNVDTSCGLVNGARGVVTRFVYAPESDDIPYQSEAVLPEVAFNVSVGNKKSTITIVVQREKWSIEEPVRSMLGTTEVRELASRVQIPLILAWAISIHKSQGMTIPYLDLNLSGIFEYGQAYVALSRATDLNTLIIRNYNPKVIKTHKRVIDFYRLMGYNCERRIVDTGELSQTNLSEMISKFTNRLKLKVEDIDRYTKLSVKLLNDSRSSNLSKTDESAIPESEKNVKELPFSTTPHRDDKISSHDESVVKVFQEISKNSNYEFDPNYFYELSTQPESVIDLIVSNKNNLTNMYDASTMMDVSTQSSDATILEAIAIPNQSNSCSSEQQTIHKFISRSNGQSNIDSHAFKTIQNKNEQTNRVPMIFDDRMNQKIFHGCNGDPSPSSFRFNEGIKPIHSDSANDINKVIVIDNSSYLRSPSNMSHSFKSLHETSNYNRMESTTIGWHDPFNDSHQYPKSPDKSQFTNYQDMSKSDILSSYSNSKPETFNSPKFNDSLSVSTVVLTDEQRRTMEMNRLAAIEKLAKKQRL